MSSKFCQESLPIADSDKTTRDIGYIEKYLANESATVLMVVLFSASLLLWSFLDHAIPSYDAAAHAGYSSMFRHFFTHTKEWNFSSLLALFKMMPNYPAGIWFLNGFAKALLGESHFSEQVILTGYTALLSFGVWSSTFLLLQDKLKAALAVFFVNTCPVILFLAHSPFIDLPFLAILSVFCSSTIWWWQQQNWKRAALVSLSLGIVCISKQIALLYTMPCLFVLGLLCLRQRRLHAIVQLATMAGSAALFLCTWVIPNFQEIVTYSSSRSAYAAAHFGFWQRFGQNMVNSYYLVIQSLSLVSSGVACFFLFKQTKFEWKTIFPLLGPSTFGVLLINWVAYYNEPETRYFTPLTMVICIVLASGTAKYLRMGQRNATLCTVFLGFVLLQSISLTFTALTPTWTFQSRIANPAVFISGIREQNMLEHLPYVAKGDLWKQQWLFDLIESRDGNRPVYLNVLSNSRPYNLNSISFVVTTRKSKVKPTTWRGCGPDMRDIFAYSPESPFYMHWIVEKTGDENDNFFNEQSHLNYLNLLRVLKTSGEFEEKGRQNLPDGTQLVVYRNKRLI